jgi:DNA-binding XRE family transcriptional regulator
MTLAEFIKDLRQTLFLTQTDLAKALGASQACIWQWENREGCMLSMKMRRKLYYYMKDNKYHFDLKDLNAICVRR